MRFKSRNIRTVRYVIETSAFVGFRIWSYMPSELKESMSLNEFSSKIKTWKPENCPCKLCKIYLQRIAYLQVADKVYTHRCCYLCFFISLSVCFAGFFSVSFYFCFVFCSFPLFVLSLSLKLT